MSEWKGYSASNACPCYGPYSLPPCTMVQHVTVNAKFHNNSLYYLRYDLHYKLFPKFYVKKWGITLL